MEHNDHHIDVKNVMPNLNGEPDTLGGLYAHIFRHRFDLRDPDRDIVKEVYNTIDHILEVWYSWTLLGR